MGRNSDSKGGQHPRKRPKKSSGGDKTAAAVDRSTIVGEKTSEIEKLAGSEKGSSGLERSDSTSEECNGGPNCAAVAFKERYMAPREEEFRQRSKMTALVLKSLSILLGLFFIFVGITKLTPIISKELYKELRKEYAAYTKVIPLAHLLPFRIRAKWYRRVVGALEVVCGIGLALIPSKRVKQVANTLLLLLMVFATYSHWRVGDKFEKIAPSLVFFFMLSCRLVVEYQIKKKLREEEARKAEMLLRAKKHMEEHASTAGVDASTNPVSTPSAASISTADTSVDSRDVSHKKQE